MCSHCPGLRNIEPPTRSPTLSPEAHQPPISPLRIAHSPENHLPTPYHGNKVSAAKLSMTVPQTGSVTTAQDLLNDVMGMGGSNISRQGFTSIIHPAQGHNASQPKFLFGSDLSLGPSQSIWSAARDEQPLIYSGNNTATSVGFNGHLNGSHIVGATRDNFQTTTPSGQIYQTSLHTVAASPDSFVSHQSIWSPYGARTTSPQHNLPFSPSTISQHQKMSSTVIPQSPQHRREQSISRASYLTPLYSNIQRDPFTYSSSVLQQPVIHQPDPHLSAHFSPSIGHDGLQPFAQSAAIGLIPGDAREAFYNRSSGYHSRQISNQNQNSETGQLFLSSTISDLR